MGEPHRPDGFRSLPLDDAYTTGTDPLRRFYIPVLTRAVRYDRAAGYFATSGLAVAARGLAGLIRNGGRMRLIAGAALDPDDVQVITQGAPAADVTAERIIRLLGTAPPDEVHRRRLEALCWMVATGALEMRVALARDLLTGRLLAAGEAPGYFHVKIGVVTDRYGDRVAFTGSTNETAAGWTVNYETFDVYRSWVEPTRVDRKADDFDRWWARQDPHWDVIPVPEAVRQRLIELAPDTPPTRDPAEPEAPPPVVEVPEDLRVVAAWLADLSRLVGVDHPGVVTTTTIDPWPHQVRVATTAAGRFPDRFLFADEVGLGKTIEAGLALRDLVVAGHVERCLILTPRSVITQWQDELHEKFGLDVPIADWHSLGWPGRNRPEQPLDGRNPWDVAPILLMSSHLAKRKDNQPRLLEAPPWDLVIVDEAHHARRREFREDLTHREPNRLLALLEGSPGSPGLAERTRGLWLLSATPMQIHAAEVWDLVNLCGLPARWGASERRFLAYFTNLALPWSKIDWRTVLPMAADELEAGGDIAPDVTASLRDRLGPARLNDIVNIIRDSRTHPDRAAARIAGIGDPEGRRHVLGLLRHLTPLRRRMFRHTRGLLRTYRSLGLLTANIAERKPEPRWIKMTSAERQLYDRVEEYIRDFYRRYEEHRRGLGFVMTIYRRRLTSSFWALRCSLERRARWLRGELAPSELFDDDELEDETLLPEDLGIDPDDEPPAGRPDGTIRAVQREELAYVEDFLTRLDHLGDDSKVDQLFDDLQRAFATRETVVVFTQYTDTMDHLRDRLVAVYGTGVGCYSGRGGERWSGTGWEPVTKDEIKTAFRDGRIKVLLGTDALAEGLNLQTCGVEINFDVPWNPMRLEQRIGRIDRIGQRHPDVWLWHYFYADTIDARVYATLAERINVFHGVVGRLQPILGTVEATIRDAAVHGSVEEYLGRLTCELDRVEQDPITTGMDLDALAETNTTITTAPALPPPPLTPDQLEDLLCRQLPTRRLFTHHGRIPGAWTLHHGGTTRTVTFHPAVADDHPATVELLDPVHPLVRDLAGTVPAVDPGRFGLVRIQLPGDPTTVAWYDTKADPPRPLDTLDSLRGALTEGSVNPARAARAEQAAGALVAKHQEAALRRHRALTSERRSALIARACDIGAEAAFILHALAHPDADQHPPGQAAVDALRAQGFPWAPLLRLITEHQAEVDPRDVPAPVTGEHRSGTGRLHSRFSRLTTEAESLLRRLAAPA